MSGERLCLGFVGGGVNSAVGDTHFIAARMDGLFELVAGCFSLDPDANQETGRRRGVAAERTYASLNELIDAESGQLDALVVLTPTPDHVASVTAALQASFPVICEKALATTSEEALAIHRLAQDKALPVTVTYNYTGYPMVRELKWMIGQGRLGQIEQIHVEMPQEGYARLGRDGASMVPQQWRLCDGAVPTISLDLGVHAHHLVDFLTGEKPREIIAVQSSLGRFHEVIDNVMVLARYTNDLAASFWYSKAALGYRNGLRVRVFGDQGAAEWYQMDPEVLLLHDTRGNSRRLDRASNEIGVAHLPRYNRFKSGHPAGFLEAFANLYADIASQLTGVLGGDEAEYVFPAHTAWEGLVMLEAIAASARERRWVEVHLGASLR